MRYARSSVVILAVVTIGVTSAGIARGQENKKDEPPTALKKGDEVIALRVAPLQVEAKTVGTVRAGDKLVVEEVQGDWLWVRAGETRGWIERTSIVDAAFQARCKSQGDLSTAEGAFAAWTRGVDKSGCAGARILGVTFELTSLKTPCYPNIQGVIAGGILQVGVGNVYNGPPPGGVPDNVSVDYRSVKLAVQKVDDRRRALSVNGRPYGDVSEGDHVLIRESREVFVNGFLRKPRG
jgi:hypothetical protein